MYRENATGQVLKPTHVFIRSQYTCRTWSQHDRKCGRHLSFIQHYHDQKRRRDRANERATANDIPSVFHCERVWCFGTLVLNPIRCDTPPAYTHLSMQCMCISRGIYLLYILFFFRPEVPGKIWCHHPGHLWCVLGRRSFAHGGTGKVT